MPRVTVVTAPPGSGRRRHVDEHLAPGPGVVRLDLGPADRGRPPPPVPAQIRAGTPADPLTVVTGLEVLSGAGIAELVGPLLPGRARLVLVGTAGLPAHLVVRLGADLAEVSASDLWSPPGEVRDRLARLAGVDVTRAQAE